MIKLRKDSEAFQYLKVDRIQQPGTYRPDLVGIMAQCRMQNDKNRSGAIIHFANVEIR
jgi:hypothetical protein